MPDAELHVNPADPNPSPGCTYAGCAFLLAAPVIFFLSIWLNSRDGGILMALQIMGLIAVVGAALLGVLGLLVWISNRISRALGWDTNPPVSPEVRAAGRSLDHALRYPLWTLVMILIQGFWAMMTWSRRQPPDPADGSATKPRRDEDQPTRN